MKKSLIQKSDKIFITGHRGMAGSAIYRALEKKGYKNLIIENRKNLDLSKYTDVNNWFEKVKPDIVTLCAAKVGGIEANLSMPTEFLLENLRIQNNVIEAAWKNNVKRLLFLGSSCIYPKYCKQPIEEEELLTGKLEMTNESYALAKICGLRLCTSLRTQYGFDAISLMPTNLYGPGDNYHQINSHVLASLIRRFTDAVRFNQDEVTCWGSGFVYREFLHADDLGDACCFVLENWDPRLEGSPKKNNGEVLDYLNVGTGVDLTIRDLAELIAKNVNYKGKINWDNSKQDGTPKKLLNISRLKSLGWKPKIDLNEGIKRTVLEYKLKFNVTNII